VRERKKRGPMKIGWGREGRGMKKGERRGAQDLTERRGGGGKNNLLEGKLSRNCREEGNGR